MLREDLAEIVKFAADMGMTLHLDTNGIGLSSRLGALRKAGLNHVFISLDSVIREEHNTQRGNDGCFQEVMSAISECGRLCFPFTLSTYITKEDISNNKRIVDIIELARKNNATGVRIVASVLAGNWSGREDLRIEDSERRYFDKMLDGFAYFETPSNSSNRRVCLSLRKKLVFISPDGQVRPCAYIPLSFGNITDENIDVILSRMWRHEIFSYDYGMDECLANHPKFLKILR